MVETQALTEVWNYFDSRLYSDYSDFTIHIRKPTKVRLSIRCKQEVRG